MDRKNYEITGYDSANRQTVSVLTSTLSSPAEWHDDEIREYLKGDYWRWLARGLHGCHPGSIKAEQDDFYARVDASTRFDVTLRTA